MAIRIVDALEVADVEQDQGAIRGMPHREGDLGAQAVFEVTAVVRAGRRIARARFVQLAQQALLARVREREAKSDPRAELHPVVVANFSSSNALALQEGAVT